jgi:hypothetical protein
MLPPDFVEVAALLKKNLGVEVVTPGEARALIKTADAQGDGDSRHTDFGWS